MIDILIDIVDRRPKELVKLEKHIRFLCNISLYDTFQEFKAKKKNKQKTNMINNRGGKIIEVMILWGKMMMIFNEIKRVRGRQRRFVLRE